MTTPRAPNALAGALARIGDRWSLQVVDALNDGPRRFADLQSDLPGIATNVLSERLRRLEGDRVVVAVPYSRRPVRYSYSLTEAGRALAGAARALAQWGSEHGGGHAETPSHPACGTAMVARWWCPTCEQPGDAGPAGPVWV
ncbi:MAG: winged helix-turn-helix transcriptional regulator [Acidimicrobiales bacterium]